MLKKIAFSYKKASFKKMLRLLISIKDITMIDFPLLLQHSNIWFPNNTRYNNNHAILAVLGIRICK